MSEVTHELFIHHASWCPKISWKKFMKTFSWCLNAVKRKSEQKLIIFPCPHSPPYLFWRKIGTQSHSAKFLNWGDHVNPVPDLAASPPLYVVFAKEPSHCAEKFRILTDHALFVLFTGYYFFEAVSLQGVVTLSWIEKLDMNRSKSVSEILAWGLWWLGLGCLWHIRMLEYALSHFVIIVELCNTYRTF